MEGTNTLSFMERFAVCSFTSLSLCSPKGFNPWTTFLPTFLPSKQLKMGSRTAEFWACTVARSLQVPGKGKCLAGRIFT